MRLLAVTVIILVLQFVSTVACTAAVDLGRVEQSLHVTANADPSFVEKGVPAGGRSLTAGTPAPGRFFEFPIVTGSGPYPGATLNFGQPVDFSGHDVLAVWLKTSAPLRELQATVNGTDGVIVDHWVAGSAAAPGAIIPANTWTRAYISYRGREGWVRFGAQMDFTRIKSVTFYTFDSSLSRKVPLYTLQVGGLQLLSAAETKDQFLKTVLRPALQTAALLKRDRNGVVWTVNAGEKILRDTALPTRSPAATAATAAVAKNEYASLVWVVKPAHNWRKVRGRVGELVCGKDKIPASSIALRYVDYVQGPLFDSPDPLPLFPTRQNGKQLKVTAGQNLQVWATVSVPLQTTSGTYTGSLTLEAESAAGPIKMQLPLRVRVRPFALPRQRHLQSLFTIHHLYNSPDQWLAENSKRYWGQNITPYGAEYRAIMDSVYRDFSHIRMTPELHLSWREYPTLQERLALHEKYGFDPVFSFGYNCSGLYAGLPLGESEARTKARQRIREDAAKWQSVEHLGLTAVKIGDEPTPELMPAMAMAAEDVKTVAPGARRFAALTTLHIPEELIGKLDTWCMQWDFDFTSPAAKERLRAGDSLWTYGAEYKSNSAYMPLELRAPYWLYWKWNITGVHYSHHLHSVYLTYPNDTYPHSDGLQEIPSIRWEMIGHGAQDYEYLWLLNDLIQKAGPRGEKYRSLLQVPAELAAGQLELTNSPQVIDKRREAIALAIEDLQKGK